MFVATVKKRVTKLKNNLKKATDKFSQQETGQTMKMITGFFAEFFKVSMACLLSLFVPQRCEHGDLCTLQDNFKNLDNYNIFVIFLNFTSLGYFLWCYIYEMYRENYMIKKLDVDDHEDDYYLVEEVKKFPKIEQRLTSINNNYHQYNKILYALMFSNFVASAVLVLHFWYLDYRTVTTLLTNMLLVVGKISKSIDVSEQSVREKIAISNYITKYVRFNRVDRRYRDKIAIPEKTMEEAFKEVKEPEPVLKQEDINIVDKEVQETERVNEPEIKKDN